MARYPNWGATTTELTRVMDGDYLVTGTTYVSTMAVTIDARLEDTWPWLAQMGYRRGGLYSYDWLDRLVGFLDRASADRVLPEYQHISPGDVIPLGRGPGLAVRAVQPGHILVLGGEVDNFVWIWQFALYSVYGHRTRLVTRYTARIPRSIGGFFFRWWLKPAAFLMTRRLLLGIKERAERLSIERREARAA